MSIQITGLDALFRKLTNVQAKRILRPPMQRALYRLVRRLAIYPPQPSGSKYVRSGTLGRKWTAPDSSKITEFPNGLEGRVGNNIDYGPFVQSSRFQTAQHRRTGWITDAQAAREEERAIVADFQRAIDEALR